jgi:hypothetical protein
LPQKRVVASPLAQVQTPEKIVIPGWNFTQFLILPGVLNVGFNQGMQLLHLAEKEMLALNHTIDHRLERSRC